MPFEQIIKQILADFTIAWNDWNFEAIEKFLCTDVVITSPKIKELYPENVDGIIRGKENLINYWKRYHQQIGELKVIQLSYEKNGRIVKTTNKITDQPIIIQEELMLNEYGKIVHLKYEYYATE